MAARVVKRMKRLWRNNGLSIVMLGMFFLLFIWGQTYSGWLEENQDRTADGLQLAIQFRALFRGNSVEKFHGRSAVKTLDINIVALGKRAERRVGEKSEPGLRLP